MYSIRRLQIRLGLDKQQMRYLFETFRLGTVAEFLRMPEQSASDIRSSLGLPAARRGPPSAQQRATNGAAPTSRYFS